MLAVCDRELLVCSKGSPEPRVQNMRLAYPLLKRETGLKKNLKRTRRDVGKGGTFAEWKNEKCKYYV